MTPPQAEDTPHDNSTASIRVHRGSNDNSTEFCPPITYHHAFVPLSEFASTHHNPVSFTSRLRSLLGLLPPPTVHQHKKWIHNARSCQCVTADGGYDLTLRHRNCRITKRLLRPVVHAPRGEPMGTCECTRATVPFGLFSSYLHDS